MQYMWNVTRQRKKFYDLCFKDKYIKGKSCLSIYSLSNILFISVFSVEGKVFSYLLKASINDSSNLIRGWEQFLGVMLIHELLLMSERMKEVND